jgi:hypothetical protein
VPDPARSTVLARSRPRPERRSADAPQPRRAKQDRLAADEVPVLPAGRTGWTIAFKTCPFARFPVASAPTLTATGADQVSPSGKRALLLAATRADIGQYRATRRRTSGDDQRRTLRGFTQRRRPRRSSRSVPGAGDAITPRSACRTAVHVRFEVAVSNCRAVVMSYGNGSGGCSEGLCHDRLPGHLPAKLDQPPPDPSPARPRTRHSRLHRQLDGRGLKAKPLLLAGRPGADQFVSQGADRICQPDDALRYRLRHSYRPLHADGPPACSYRWPTPPRLVTGVRTQFSPRCQGGVTLLCLPPLIPAVPDQPGRSWSGLPLARSSPEADWPTRFDQVVEPDHGDYMTT